MFFSFNKLNFFDQEHLLLVFIYIYLFIAYLLHTF